MGFTTINLQSNQQSHFVTDWLDKRARLTPERVGLIDHATGVETTFAEWDQIVFDAMPLTASGKLDKKPLESKEIPV